MAEEDTLEEMQERAQKRYCPSMKITMQLLEQYPCKNCMNIMFCKIVTSNGFVDFTLFVCEHCGKPNEETLDWQWLS